MELNKFVELFAGQFEEVDKSEITADTCYQDLEEWGSLTAISVITFIDVEYGVSVTGVEIRSCESIEELFDLVVSKKTV